MRSTRANCEKTIVCREEHCSDEGCKRFDAQKTPYSLLALWEAAYQSFIATKEATDVGALSIKLANRSALMYHGFEEIIDHLKSASREEPKKPATSVEKQPEEPTKSTLDDFAKKHNLRVVAQKDEGFLSTKHYVCLENTGVTTGGPLDMRYSCRGSTLEEAKAAYAASISEKTIRVTRPNGDHELIKVPMLVG